jgi:hypothetical protein
MTAELTTFVDIDAPPERVWDVLTDAPSWPAWNEFISSAQGTFSVGQRVLLEVPRLHAVIRPSMQLTVLEVDPCRRLRFRLAMARLGLPGLFSAEHTLTLTREDGVVRLWEDAVFSGLLVPLVSRSLNRRYISAFEATNVALKNRIEASPPVRSAEEGS